MHIGRAYLAPLILIITASSCQTRTSIREPDLPVIVVDNAHNHIGPARAETPAAYTIMPADGFMLDATGYMFTVPPNSPAAIPNVAQVLIDKSKSMYALQWSQSTARYRVSAATLSPVRGAPRFQRVEAGTTVVIAIGYQHDPGGGGAGFFPFWIGLVKVGPPRQ